MLFVDGAKQKKKYSLNISKEELKNWQLMMCQIIATSFEHNVTGTWEKYMQNSLVERSLYGITITAY